MSRFSKEDIIEYYDTTEIHYRRAWDLDNSLAMHYGYWDEDTKDFRSSLANMNFALAEFGDINKGSSVLDAGCGLGGSSIYLSKALACQTTGISLSKKQIESARQNAVKNNVSHASFEVADFTHLPFEDQSYDYIWAIEALVHSEEKIKFFAEAHRVLKPGGAILIAEYIKTADPISHKAQRTLEKWLNAWAIKDIEKLNSYKQLANEAGFSSFESKDVTPNIRKSAWRMFYGSFFMTVLSSGYRLLNSNVSKFADNHHKAMYHQYPALRKNLWSYHFIKIQK